MKYNSKDTLPIVVELKKRHWQLYTLAIYNMSFIQFIDLLEADLQIKQIQILNREESGELKEINLSDQLDLRRVKELTLKQAHGIKSIHVQMERDTDIDSNFNDEVYLHFWDTFDLQMLLDKLIQTRMVSQKLILPVRKHSFCLEIYKGKIHQFDSLDQYVKGRANFA